MYYCFINHPTNFDCVDMHNHIHSAAYTISSLVSYDWVCKNMNNPCKKILFYNQYSLKLIRMCFVYVDRPLTPPSPLVDKHGHFDNPLPLLCLRGLYTVPYYF